eukprot:349824-Chlamydomonas_euryale.AAC.1
MSKIRARVRREGEGGGFRRQVGLLGQPCLQHLEGKVSWGGRAGGTTVRVGGAMLLTAQAGHRWAQVRQSRAEGRTGRRPGQRRAEGSTGHRPGQRRAEGSTGHRRTRRTPHLVCGLHQCLLLLFKVQCLGQLACGRLPERGVHVGRLPSVVDDERARRQPARRERLEALPDAARRDGRVERVPRAPSKQVKRRRQLLARQRRGAAAQARGLRDAALHKRVWVGPRCHVQRAAPCARLDARVAALHAQREVALRHRPTAPGARGVSAARPQRRPEAAVNQRQQQCIRRRQLAFAIVIAVVAPARTAARELGKQELRFRGKLQRGVSPLGRHPPQLAARAYQHAGHAHEPPNVHVDK